MTVEAAPFEVAREGWGEFEVFVDLYLSDGTMHSVNHVLSFASAVTSATVALEVNDQSARRAVQSATVHATDYSILDLNLGTIDYQLPFTDSTATCSAPSAPNHKDGILADVSHVQSIVHAHSQLHSVTLSQLLPSQSDGHNQCPSLSATHTQWPAPGGQWDSS